jgi:Pirin-related protein
MITLRPSKERGHFQHGWLDTYHTFSFDKYHDPKHMGFRALRVINEDRIGAMRGFGMHPHKDMEILTYVLEGELTHQDSLGHGSSIHPHELQRMTAGTGVTHSEFNHQKDPVHLLQIWVLPERKGLSPGYEQKAFPAQEKHNRLRLVASPDFAEGSLKIHQDVRLYASLLDGDVTVAHIPWSGTSRLGTGRDWRNRRQRHDLARGRRRSDFRRRGSARDRQGRTLRVSAL